MYISNIENFDEWLALSKNVPVSVTDTDKEVRMLNMGIQKVPEPHEEEEDMGIHIQKVPEPREEEEDMDWQVVKMKKKSKPVYNYNC